MKGIVGYLYGMVKPSWLADEFKYLYLGLAVLWTVAAPGSDFAVAAPGSDFAVAVLPLLCALLLWRGVLRVEAMASPRG